MSKSYKEILTAGYVNYRLENSTFLITDRVVAQDIIKELWVDGDQEDAAKACLKAARYVVGCLFYPEFDERLMTSQEALKKAIRNELDKLDLPSNFDVDLTVTTALVVFNYEMRQPDGVLGAIKCVIAEAAKHGVTATAEDATAIIREFGVEYADAMVRDQFCGLFASESDFYVELISEIIGENDMNEEAQSAIANHFDYHGYWDADVSCFYTVVAAPSGFFIFNDA